MVGCAVDSIKKADEKVAQLITKLKSRGETLSCAESCTGGLLSSWITRASGVSSVYVGGVVSYSGALKSKLLGVKSPTIKVLGEVSIPVAQQMARGARRELGSDWAISVTGVAGPTGGTKEKPVGFVCFAVCGPGIERAVSHKFSLQERHEIQQASALFALDFLLAEI